MAERVTVSIRDHVAEVTLNRPDKHNALDMPMFEALVAAGERLAADTSVRAVVLAGNGANFCAGIDTSLFAPGATAIDPAMLEPSAPSPANLFQRAAFIWRELPVPVICAIKGVAYGGGLQVALGADIRYAHPDARLAIMEIRWGIIPDMAITTTLGRCMAPDSLKELALTGRVVGATEAARLRMVTAVHDEPLAAARATAGDIAAKSPDAVCAIKQLFDRAWSLPDTDALRLEARLQLGVLGGFNQREAVRAVREGADAVFRDRSE